MPANDQAKMVAAFKRMDKLLEKNVKQQKDLADILKEMSNKIGKIKGAKDSSSNVNKSPDAKDEMKRSEKELKNLRKQKELQNTISRELETQFEAHVSNMKLISEEYEIRKQIHQLSILTYGHNSAQAIAQAELVREAKARYELAVRQQGIDELGEQHALRLAEVMGGVRKDSQTFAGNFVKALNTSGGLTRMMQGFKRGMKDTLFSLEAMTTAGLDKIIESTMLVAIQTEQAISSFQKATGASDEYASQIEVVHNETMRYGVDATQAAEAMTNLSHEMMNFNTLSSQTQNELAGTIALLDQIGVSATTSSKSMDLMINSMGLSTTEAQQFTNELADLGAMLGNSAQAFEDFNASAKVLHAYGKDAKSVFIELEKSAKATKIQMSELLVITNQFDTFEGAAEAAAGLNSILGGGLLNASQLVLASEEERIRLLIESIQLSGKSWDAMKKHERMAIANAAGINDMTVANKLFSMSLSAYDESMVKNEKMAESQKALEERAMEVKAIWEEWKIIIQQTAIAMQPLLDIVKTFVEWIIEANEALGGKLIPILTGAGLAYIVFGKVVNVVLSGLSLGLKATGAAATTASPGIVTLGNALGTFATAAAKAVPVVLGFAASILVASIGIGLVVGSLVLLAYALKDMSGEGVTTLAVMAGLILAVGFAGSAASSGMIQFGAGMLLVGAGVALIGAGIWLMAEGFETFVESFQNLDLNKFMQFSLSLMAFSAALGILVPVLAAFALISLPAFLGLSMFSAGLALMKEALGSTNDLDNLATLFESLAKIVEESEKLSKLPGIIGDVVDKLNALNMVKLLLANALGSWFDAFNDDGWIAQINAVGNKIKPVVELVSTINSEKVQQVSELAQSIKVITESTANPSKEQVELLKAIASKSDGHENGGIVVKVYLDSKEISAKAVKRIENNRTKSYNFAKRIKST